MKIRTSLYVQLGLLLLICAIYGYYFRSLPDVVPTHFNLAGKPDGYGSKWSILWMGPVLIGFSMILTVGLPKISPRKFEIDRFASTFGYAMVLVAALYLFISIWTLLAVVGGRFDGAKGMMCAMFIFFALLGNVLGKVRRNFFIGIRTPWTLANETVWNKTHRSAGHLYFVGGLVGAAFSLAGTPMAVTITYLIVLALFPAVQSYFIYRQVEPGPYTPSADDNQS